MELTWDEVGKKLYETGVSKGVLFPQTTAGAYSKGVAWNGLSGVTESPSGAESTPMFANNRKYLNLMSNEDFGATIEAFTYPDEFGACNGEAELAKGVSIGQQTRTPFGMSYQTIIGNDTKGNEYGYKIHLIYGAQAAPSEKANKTVNESPEAMTLSWEVTTTPVEVKGFKPTAHLTIDSTKVDADKLAQLEAIIYGSENEEPRLPLPDEVAELVGIAG